MDTYWIQQERLAEAIAREAHDGQVRRGGAPYIEHPARVAASVQPGRERCVAWLHDVLEDTGMSRFDLTDQGVSRAVASAVWYLSKTSGESYAQYLARVRGNKVATKVKIADMLDNLCDKPTDRQKEKYCQGIMFLAQI